MWNTQVESITDTVDQYRILKEKKPIDYNTWIHMLKTSERFALFFNNVLKTSRFEAFFWEVKPISSSGQGQVFEFVLVQSTSLLSTIANERAFKSHFSEGKKVISFFNLGKDAKLVVPTKLADSACYGHLAAFVRQAPQSQILHFWKKVAEEYELQLGDAPKWLSTAGLGVPWLHVRIDSRPKYYRYKEYR